MEKVNNYKGTYKFGTCALEEGCGLYLTFVTKAYFSIF